MKIKGNYLIFESPNELYLFKETIKRKIMREENNNINKLSDNIKIFLILNFKKLFNEYKDFYEYYNIKYNEVYEDDFLSLFNCENIDLSVLNQSSLSEIENYIKEGINYYDTIKELITGLLFLLKHKYPLKEILNFDIVAEFADDDKEWVEKTPELPSDLENMSIEDVFEYYDVDYDTDFCGYTYVWVKQLK